ncbi:MAG: hypothetical protein HY673_19395 [Chloroflexi bacterium]|nr:hypothetical protein [Chloroflexota bacterium]
MKRSLLVVLLIGVAVIVVSACGQPTPATTSPPPVQQATPKPKTEAPPVNPPAAPASPAAPTAKAAGPTQKPAPSGTTYYQGKTIEILVDSAAGGGTDTMGRITAAMLPKHIPGNPKIIVRNQSGGGGTVGTNIFYEKTKPDGLSLLQHGSGVVSLQLTSRGIVKYDLTKMRYVGNVSRAESVLMVRKGLQGRLTDPRGEPLVVGTKEGSETWQIMLIFGREFLGWNVRWLPGLGGTSEMELGFRRGELDAFATSNSFIVQRMLQEGLAETIATTGSIKDGKFIRRPDFPDIATFEEVMGSKKPSGLPWQAYLAWVGPNAVDKSLAAPPGTPDNVMAILTDAFGKMTKSSEFESTVKKMVTEAYDVGVGKETDDMLKTVLQAPAEALEYNRQLMIKFGIISK